MSITTSGAGKIADDIIHLLEERGTGDYIGETISQLAHSLQAANFAVQAGSKDETVIAALLHDIGQFLPLDAVKDVQMSMGDHSVGRVGHERIGEEYLRGLEIVFRRSWEAMSPQRAVDASYYDGLSEASKQSLRFQGWPFAGEDLEAFERDPLKDEMVKVRKWDDQAKIIGIENVTPRAEAYRVMIQRHLQAQ